MAGRFFKLLTVLAAAGLLAWAGPARAEDDKDGKETHKTDEVVVVASPIIEGNQVSDLGAQMTVVSEEQIENLNAGDLPSALRRTPGVVISRHNPVGSFGGGAGGAVFIRGMGSGRPGQDSSTLLDGIPMMVGVWSHSVMDMLSIDNVHALEVYKGAQPVLWGNAAFGSINIVPKYMAEEGFRTRFKLAGGSYNTFVETAEHGGRIKDFDYYLVQSYRAGDGHRDDAGGELQNYYGNLGYSISPTLRVSLLVNQTDNWTDDPGPEGHPEEKDGRFKTRDRMGILKLANDNDWGDGWLKFYWDEGHLDWQDQSDGTDTRTDYDNYGLRLRETLTLWRGGGLTVGYDHDYISGKVLTVNGSNYNYGDRVTFRLVQPYAALSQEIPLGPVTLIPSAGVRWFDHSQFGGETGYQAGLVARIGQTELHGNYAHTYNYPGVYVVQQSRMFWRGSTLWEDLEPEELDHWEAGVSQVFTSWLKADLTWFQDKGDNRLVFVAPPPHWENIGEFDNKGLEATLTITPTRDLAFFVGGTWLDASPEDLPYAPEWSGSAGVNWSIIPGLMLSLDASYVDGYYTTDTRYSGSRASVDSYFLVNAKLAYTFLWDKLEMTVFAAGENLTDQEYQYKPDYPMPGINGMAGVEFAF